MIMKRTLLIAVILCASAFAMAPRKRFARESKKICEPQTPCSWSAFNESTKIVYMVVENTYCECAKNMNCTFDEEEESSHVFVNRCKPLSI